MIGILNSIICLLMKIQAYGKEILLVCLSSPSRYPIFPIANFLRKATHKVIAFAAGAFSSLFLICKEVGVTCNFEIQRTTYSLSLYSCYLS